MRGCRDVESLVKRLATGDQAPLETLAIGSHQGVSMLNFTMQISWLPERTGEMQQWQRSTQKTAHAALWAIPGYQQQQITSVAARVENVMRQNVWTRASGLALNSDGSRFDQNRQSQSKRAYSKTVTLRFLMVVLDSVTLRFLVRMIGEDSPIRHCERAFDRTLPVVWHKIIRGFAYYLDAAGRLAGRKRASDVSLVSISISLARFRHERRTSERQGGDATLELSLLGFSLNDQVVEVWQ